VRVGPKCDTTFSLRLALLVATSMFACSDGGAALSKMATSPPRPLRLLMLCNYLFGVDPANVDSVP
jgi:hypothetical protein